MNPEILSLCQITSQESNTALGVPAKRQLGDTHLISKKHTSDVNKGSDDVILSLSEQSDLLKVEAHLIRYEY